VSPGAEFLPPGTPGRLTRLLVQAAGDRALVFVQNPVRLSRTSEPQPDFAVLKPRADDYQSATPGPEDVFLLVEIAETSLEFDRELKAPLSAAHGIPELWVVDVSEKALWLHRDPRPDGYARVEKTTQPAPTRLAAAPEIEVDLGGLFA